MRITTILFQNTVTQKEIIFLRGAVAYMADYATMFHNHLLDKYHYAYPLVQYKRIGGRAAIIGIDKGAKAVELLFGEGKDVDCQLGRKGVTLRVDCIFTSFRSIVIHETVYTYSLENWLPFHTENRRRFEAMEDENKQINMLEHILIGNILSASKGVGVFFDQNVQCRFVELVCSGNVAYKEMDMKCFSVVFESNVFLPDHIGLGRGVSIGYGIITQIRK